MGHTTILLFQFLIYYCPSWQRYDSFLHHIIYRILNKIIETYINYYSMSKIELSNFSKFTSSSSSEL